MNTVRAKLGRCSAAQLVSQCLGWGDPTGKGLWFIGLEEGSAWTEEKFPTDEDVREYLLGKEGIEVSNSDDCFWYPEKWPPRDSEHPHGRMPVSEFISKIATVARGDAMDNWRTFRRDQLYQAQARVFHANLWPIGKKKHLNQHSNHDRQLFGELLGSWDSFEEQRWTALRRLVSEHKPVGIVCFGSTRAEAFTKALGLQTAWADVTGVPGVKESRGDCARVLLTKHFSRAFRNATAEQVGRLLRDSRV